MFHLLCVVYSPQKRGEIMLTIEQRAHDLTILYLTRYPRLIQAPQAYANEYMRIYKEILTLLTPVR